MTEAATSTDAAGVARRILIVDDDQAFRLRLARAMERRGYQVTLAASVAEGKRAAAAAPPDYAVVDLRLNDGSGLDVVAAIREATSEARVVVLTGYGNIATAVAAMKAGAIDFVEKPVADKALFSAIDKALEWSRAQSEPRESRDAARRIAALTPRERLVLNAMLEGRQDNVVASDLGVSVRAVEAQRKMLLQHLGVEELSQAIRLGVIAQLQRLRSTLR